MYMNLTLNSIIYKLKDFVPAAILRDGDGSREFAGVIQYYKEDYNLKRDYLYITRASLLVELNKKIEEGAVYLCINDSEEEIELLCRIVSTFILIPGEYLLEQVLNRTVEIFDEFRHWDKTMHIATLEGATPQEMVLISKDMMQMPMIIFDASFNVLAHTKDTDLDYEFYNTTIANGYTQSEIILKLKKEHVFEALDNNEGVFVYSSAGVREYSNVYIKIQVEDRILGYGCIFTNEKEVDQGHLDIMKCFIENLKLYFIQNYKNSKYGKFMYENFLVTLIQNPNMEEEQLKEQLKYIDGIEEQGNFVLIMFEFNKRGEVPLAFIAKEIKNIFYNGYPFLVSGRIYLLYQLKQGGNTLFSDTEKERFDYILKNYDYQCYVSKCFQNIKEISLAEVQCIRTMELLNDIGGSKNINYFVDYTWQHLITIWSEKFPVSMLMSDAYIKLKEYCKKNQNSATKTGKELFMHRNTILYTINKIEAMLEINFDDFQVSQSFLISFLIDEN